MLDDLIQSARLLQHAMEMENLNVSVKLTFENHKQLMKFRYLLDIETSRMMLRPTGTKIQDTGLFSIYGIEYSIGVKDAK